MFKRFRRLRINETLRNMVSETSLSTQDFIYPLFVVEGKNIKNEVSSMPGVFQMSLDSILKECEELVEMGLNSIILFAIPTLKDSIGSECLDENSLISRSVQAIKKDFPNMFIVSDLCFCEYTDHGHCGIIDPKTNTVHNDKTLEISAQQALVHARAGVDMIAPSGMMDGIIKTLRKVLDDNGFENLPIMAYSSKFASGYYGPFGDVAQSAPSYGDRKTYQMNPGNRLEAIEESLADEAEGADILMVKPGLSYLDVLTRMKDVTNLPLAVYQVSGTYSMVKAASEKGWINEELIVPEMLLSFKRAGANMILTYFAKDVARKLN